MEQARILQSFITNMEMAQQIALHRGGTQGANNRSISTEPATLSTPSSDQRLIDVSDEDNDSDDDSDDSDDDDDDESDDDEESMNDDTPNNEIVSIVSSKIPIIEIDELEHDSDNESDNDNNNDIKVIQLPENTLEEFNPEVLDMNTLSWLDKRVNKQDDSEADSDDNSSINDSIADSIQSLSEEEQQIVNEVKKEKIPIADYKTLSVQTLRQIAEDNELIKKGEKKTKKELLSLLENTKK
jgi:mannosyl-glycoprotein endo-beta-N-acetylglucosaminidase